MSVLVENETISRLWQQYKETSDIEIRNLLVLRYVDLVKSIVRRISSISNNYAEAEDLTSYGMIGLIKAIEKFDINKGVTFETFATYRIRGEVIDYMRRNDWVPRGVRKRAYDIENAVNNLTNELGRQPSDEELSRKLGIGYGDLKQALGDIERFNLISFEELIQDTVKIDSDFADSDTPEGSLQEEELMKVLADTLDDMPERERLVLTLYYYEELTLKEISQVMGVSESRVSQLHSRAIEKMKKKLKSYVEC